MSRILSSAFILGALLTIGYFLHAAGYLSHGHGGKPGGVAAINLAHVSAVEVALRQDPDLATDEIKVRAEGTRVILEGTVQSAAEKQRAEKLAREVRGVVRVDNRLRLAGANP